MPSVSPVASPILTRPLPPMEARPAGASSGRDYFASSASQPDKHLSQALTRTVAVKHKEIADHAFFTALNSETLSRDAYVRYLRDRLAICEALETALSRSRKAVGDIADLHFGRRAAVLKDLHALGVLTERDTMVFFPPMHPSEAAKTLTERIKEAPPLQVLAHAWVEYMGMMFGGQGMRPKLKTLFGTAEFVTFSESVPLLRKKYDAVLNGRIASPHEVTAMCEEALDAFNMHTDVLTQNLEPDTGTDGPPAVAQTGLWDAWLAAFAWVPGLFETR